MNKTFSGCEEAYDKNLKGWYGDELGRLLQVEWFQDIYILFLIHFFGHSFSGRHYCPI